jgi:hypothetical protein
MKIFFNKIQADYTYIDNFYNICIGTVGKLYANNHNHSVNQDNLCRTLTNRVQTVWATTAQKAAPYHLLRKQRSYACNSQAIYNHRFQTQYWPGTVAYPAGPAQFLADSLINSRLSLCPMYACIFGKCIRLPCYSYA